MAGIEQGVRDIMNKMEEVKNNINQLTEDMVRSWLKISFMRKHIVDWRLKN